jgi:putative hemolysin
LANFIFPNNCMEIFYIIITLLLSAFFSGMEIAFVTANQLEVELRKKKGTRRGKLLASFFEKPADFLSTMLVGNNIVLVMFASLMAALLTPYFKGFIESFLPLFFQGQLTELLFVTLASTIIMLIFGEFLPKILFRLYADKVLYFMAIPTQIISWLLYPFSYVMMSASKILIKNLLGVTEKNAERIFTRLDLENFVLSASPKMDTGGIDAEIFGNALYLKEVRVGECMVPRTEIEGVDVSTSVDELNELFITSKLSKIIVYNESIDDTIGYVHHLQMFHKPANIRAILLELPIVPETMQVTDLLNKFISEHISIACVVDEFGGTAGIVTLEDILEEIFGEIEDEHDKEEYIEVQVSDNEFLFSGRLEIDYINEKYGLNIPDDEYQTLSGYITGKTQNIPKKGEKVEIDGYRFEMEMVSDKKIESARVIRLVEEK